MDSRGLDALLSRARRHDPAALGSLVEVFSPRVFGLVLRLTGSRHLAEDLTQETFLRMVRTIAEYQHEGKFEAWLFRIASNLARDQARQRKRRGPTLTLDAPGDEGEAGAFVSVSGSVPDPLAVVTSQEDAARLAECLEVLAEGDREILLLRHYSQLSFREIADMLQIPLGTALARAHRALQKLKVEFRGAAAESASDASAGENAEG